MTKVYTVRVVRPVFQSVAIEVRALNGNSAMKKALRRVKVLPESDWTDRNLEDGDHMIHVEAVLDHQETYETSPAPHRQIREFRLGNGESDTIRYLMLSADLNARVGQVILQPWFKGADQMLQADLCSDWVEPIKFIVENDGMEGEETQQTVVCSKMSGNDNVIDFPMNELDHELAESKS